METMENPENFAAGEICENDETEMFYESEMMMNSDSGEELEGKMVMGQPGNGVIGEESSSVVMVGGYRRDRPPEDDCCPICFDAFHLPCRTSCGHWFCSSCILLHWRYSANPNPCKCPTCECLIVKLVPLSSSVIQPGEEVDKVLKDLEQYNRRTLGGWPALFRVCLFFLQKFLALPPPTRRGLREFRDPRRMTRIHNSISWIDMLLAHLYDVNDFHFFPKGRAGIIVFFEIFFQALLVLAVLDLMWEKWMLRRRARNLAQRAALQEMDRLVMFSGLEKNWYRSSHFGCISRKERIILDVPLP